MKKILLLGSLVLSSMAYDSSMYKGYSYFGAGVEKFTYSEKFLYTFRTPYKGDNGRQYKTDEKVAVKSESKSTNIVYVSGGLIEMTPKWDLSMDFASTLKPQIVDEEWNDRSDDSTIMKNNSTIFSNSMTFLLHYKLTDNHRITFGANYILNVFKRFSDPDENGNQDLTEETVATLMADIGYWFESAPVTRSEGFRLKYNLTFGLPIYENVTNTGAPGVEITDTAGYNIDTSVYVGYTLFKGLEVGVFTSYSYMYRDGDTTNYKGQQIIWPTNITQAVRGGLQVAWKFE